MNFYLEDIRLIVFDLDHTLLTGNSSYHFGSYLYRQNFFSFWKLILSLCDYTRHKWFRMPIQSLHIKSFKRLFQGHSLLDIQQYVHSFLKQYLPLMLNPPVIQRLREAQEKGNHVMILSSSPDFLVREISYRLNVQWWKATHYQVDDNGIFLGISHFMEGAEKATSVKALAEQLHLPLSAVTVYSDSSLDLPVLKIAGQAIGVSPDSHLKRICLKNGWEILS